MDLMISTAMTIKKLFPLQLTYIFYLFRKLTETVTTLD